MADKATFSLDSDDPYLSPDERKVVKRLFSHPEDFPQEFWSAVNQKVALDGEPIPHSQILGGRTVPSQYAEVLTNESTTTASFVDLTTVGPRLDGLADGLYLIQFGCQIITPSGTEYGFMGVKLNDASVASTDTVVAGSQAGDVNVSPSRSILARLENNNNNTVVAKYLSFAGGSISFQLRWILSLKVGN